MDAAAFARLLILDPEKGLPDIMSEFGLSREDVAALTKQDIVRDKRGWTADLIERVPNKYHLEDVPRCQDLREGVERIRTAPVKNVKRTKRVANYDEYESTKVARI